MSELDLLKFLQGYEGETELADFTPEELQELIDRAKENADLLRPSSKEEFKEKYFAYYDDVKDKSRKKQDW